jgi:hypothetical protein
VNAVNVENTIANFNIEATFVSEIESYMLKTSCSEQTEQTENIDRDEDITTSIASDSSDNGSIKEVEQEVAAESAIEITIEEQVAIESIELAIEEDQQPTEKADETTTAEQVEQAIAEEQVEDEVNTNYADVMKSPVPEIVVSLVPDLDDEPETQQEAVVVVPEEETTEKTVIPNLMSQKNIQKELDTYSQDDITAKHAEQEVNNLINKIVVDVITSAMNEETQPEPETKIVNTHAPAEFCTNYMSLEQEMSLLEEDKKVVEVEDEISFIDNDNSVVYSKADNDNSVVYSKADTSAEIIEHAEEATCESTNEILAKTEKLLDGSNTPLKVTNNQGKSIVTKEPPVDCFSCTVM